MRYVMQEKEHQYYNDFSFFGDRPVFIDDCGQVMTYRELDETAAEITEKVPHRALVFSFCENSIGAAAGYAAFLNHRVVPVMIDRHMEKDLRENLMSVYQPDYLYLPEELYQEYKDLECVWSGYHYYLCRTKSQAAHELYPELALLLTTSGSTGSPKLVRQSYRNIQSNAEAIAEYLEIDETERPITTLPMNYTYGLSIINSHLLQGAAILLTNHTLMEREFWRFFKEAEATSFGGVPYTYEMLKKLRFFNMDLPSLRYMTQAGGKLSPELHREFAAYAAEKHKKFIVMYGQCEATARMAYLPAEMSLEKYGSMGIAIPGGRLELVDLNGQAFLTPDVVGELVYYGENVTLGYAEAAEDLKKGDERHQRLETGDMAKRDDDGYFYIVGRKKRFLKIFGNRVNLDETERMIKTFLESSDCACGGVDDLLYVFLTKENYDRQESVKKFLTEKTGLNPKAFEFKCIDQIPKNEAGKILYRELEAFYD